jgi:hypothetical protein
MAAVSFSCNADLELNAGNLSILKQVDAIGNDDNDGADRDRNIDAIVPIAPYYRRRALIHAQ